MILVLVILWVIFVAFLAWQLLRWLPAGMDKYNPLPYVIALLPLAPFAIAAVLLVSFACYLAYSSAHSSAHFQFAQSCNLAQSYGYLCVAYAVLFLISLQSYMPYWVAKLRRVSKLQKFQKLRNAIEQNPTKEIRVMTLNCRYGKADASKIIEVAKKYHVNTLLLQELSDSLVKNLQNQGINEIFPIYCVGAQSKHNNGGFNAIFTKYSANSTCNNCLKIEAASIPNISTCLYFDGIGKVEIHFVSAHPKSPMRSCAAWSEGIRALAKIKEDYANSKSDDSSTLTIISGDLNSAVDHPSFRALLKSGFTDAGISLGKCVRTWPTWLKWPNLTLDHVLFSAKNCTAEAVWQQHVVIDGTDHLAYLCAIRIFQSK